MCGWCRVSVHRTGITASTTPNRNYGFHYTEPELRLPLHRMVFNFLSQIYYINGCPPTFYGLPFPSLIVEYPIYLFYLVSFNTEQASITMDILG
jgi:hypothetical protein